MGVENPRGPFTSALMLGPGTRSRLEPHMFEEREAHFDETLRGVRGDNVWPGDCGFVGVSAVWASFL